jgi:heme-degrading monooxygenase HmoA
MSYVVINAVTVPLEQHDSMAERFAARAGLVEEAEGFERFTLLRPADDKDVWLVETQWKDEESFQAWMSSRAFGAQHGQVQQSGSPATGNQIWTFTVAQQVG